MEYTIVLEVELLLEAFLLGAVLIFLYEVMQVLRRMKVPKERTRNIQDIFYWCIVAVATFFLLYRCNGGIIRGFAIAGVGIGMILTGKVLKMVGKGITILVRRLKDNKRRRGGNHAKEKKKI